MKIGVLRSTWWEGACAAAGHEVVELPLTVGADGNPHAADLDQRTELGGQLLARLQETQPDLLLDNGGAGLAFVGDESDGDGLQLAHEQVGATLWSHFIDPLVTTFQGLPWPVVWQSLQSRLWFKAVWDQAQAAELVAFGVPNVIHLPMAACDREYCTAPLDPGRIRPVVSFVGAQNTSFFAPDHMLPAKILLAGALGHAVRGDLPRVTFHELYHDFYHLGTPVQPDDELETQFTKTQTYFEAKLFFNAALCIRNRDRFVIFLKQKLGDAFELIGARWDTTYGLKTEPRLPTNDDYLNHLRHSAINLNLVNGNAETGLNMRHFEITAAGGFMLCYQQPEIEEHFEIGTECAVFTSERDLLDKIRYYLSHPAERCAIAQAGQQRTLREHLYSHRLQSILQKQGKTAGVQVPACAQAH